MDVRSIVACAARAKFPMTYAHAKSIIKVLIYKKKRRKGYQRKKGHRQWYSEIEINDIKMSPAKKSSAKSKTKVSLLIVLPIATGNSISDF